MKSALREHYRQIRDNIPEGTKKSKNNSISLKCIDFLDQHQTQHTIVGGYYPLENEVSLIEFFDCKFRQHIPLCLPVTREDDRELKFREWEKDKPLASGMYDIQEPGENQKILLPNMIFLPMLAFDRRGHRLGYGQGCYDTTLVQLKQKIDLITIGVAYSEQETKLIPDEEHDVTVDFIITDEETIII